MSDAPLNRSQFDELMTNMNQMVKAMTEGVAYKNNPVGSASASQYAYGIGPNSNTGLFYNPGANRDIFSAALSPASFVTQLYNAQTSRIENPMFDIITGRTAASGTNPSDFCGTPMTGGYAKLCTHQAFFGRMAARTQINVMQTTGGMVNEADTIRSLRNSAALHPYVPDILRAATNDSLTQAWLNWWTVGQQIEESMELVAISGNRATAPGSARAFFPQEFDGLDQLIKTGYVDALTGVACPAVDSIVVDWNDTDIAGTLNGATFVETFGNIIFRLKWIAQQAGFGNTVQWAILASNNAFEAATLTWPSTYYVEGNNMGIVGTDGRLNLDATEAIRMRDDMRTGKYLMIRGERYPVIITSGIEETAVGNGLSSSMYIVPMTVLGGVRTTYLEAFDMDNPEARALRANLPAGAFRPSNGGWYLLSENYQNGCFENLIYARPRLVLRTPYLAARIDNINYTLPGYSRNPVVNGASWVNGGRTFGATWMA